MKNIIAVLIVLIMVLSLFACGDSQGTDAPETYRREDESKNAQEGSDAPETGGASGIQDKPAVTFIALLQYAESGDTSVFEPHMLDAAEKAQLKASVEAEGGTVEFGDDGSITVKGRGGSYFTITLDGSVEGVDDDGNPFGFSKGKKEWPDTALGKAVPKADFAIKMQIEDEETLMITFENVTIDQAKAYGAKLREAGFSVDESEIYMPDQNMYSYSGKNADDLSAELSFMPVGGEIMCALSVGRYSEYPDTDNPYNPGTDPGTETELPSNFAFLLPSGDEGCRVLDNGSYVSIEKANGTLADCKTFADRCRNAGMTVQTESEYKTDDGKQMYFASFVNAAGDEVHIYLSEAENRFYVDLIEYQGGPGPVDPGPGGDWPTDGAAAMLPKPGFGSGFVVNEDEDEIDIQVVGGQLSDFAGYVEQLRASGFTYHSDSDSDDDLMMYSGYNQDNYCALVQYAYGTFMIMITKQPEEY